MVVLLPLVPRADSGWSLVVPLVVAGCGLGLLVSQLNNYTLGPISEERVSEAAGVNSAAGSFGLSFGLAFAGAIMLATLSVDVHAPWPTTARSSRPTTRSRWPQTLEDDAEVMSNTELEALLAERARADPGRDRAHQHRGAPARAAGGAGRSRSSPRCSAWPTRSGWSGCPSPSRPAARRGWRSAEPIGVGTTGRHLRRPLARGALDAAAASATRADRTAVCLVRSGSMPMPCRPTAT